MIVQHKTPHTFIIHNSPGYIIAFACIAILVGLPFLLGPFGLFRNHSDLLLLDQVLSVALGISAISFGFGVIYLQSFGRIVFDAATFTIIYSYTQRKGHRTITHHATYHWNDLEALEIRVIKESNADGLYCLYMLVKGTPLKLSINPSIAARKHMQRVIDQLGSFFEQHGYASSSFARKTFVMQIILARALRFKLKHSKPTTATRWPLVGSCWRPQRWCVMGDSEVKQRWKKPRFQHESTESPFSPDELTPL